MSNLPDFDRHGYLPPGIHRATHSDIYERLASFDAWGCGDRERLFAGYCRLVEALQIVGLTAEQWLGGSFVSNEDGPEDVDVVNYCDVTAYQALPPELKAMIQQYFCGDDTAKHCGCDSYFVPLPPEDHRANPDFAIVRAYWERRLGHDLAGRPKGIVSRLVELPENDTQNESADADAA